MGGKRLDERIELGKLLWQWGAVFDVVFKCFVYCGALKGCCGVLRLEFFKDADFVVATGAALVVFDGRIGMCKCHRSEPEVCLDPQFTSQQSP
jgi:hypothetical protein